MTDDEQKGHIAELAESYAANKKLRVCLRKVIREASAPIFGLSQAIALVESDPLQLIQVARDAKLEKFQDAILALEKAEEERKLLERELKEVGLGALVEGPVAG